MNIAIVEDDINMRKSLELSLKTKKYNTISFRTPKDALKKLDDTIDLVITDLNMPGMDGISFLKSLDGRYDSIVITGNATLSVAIDALRIGAKDFITKPFDAQVLFESIERINKLNKTIKKLPTAKKKTKKNSDNGFIAQSEALKETLKIVNKAATTEATMLLLGESGVGKEVFANYIHNTSSRAKASFVAINMAAIPESLLESELFGYEKGAFTDAQEAKSGKFEQANGGTLFLDEIGEMPIHLQAKLLRAIQEKEIQRLGSSKSIKIDVRILSATNASLSDKIKKGDFREDLYYRLNTIPVNIPPLRERKEEILPIASHILDNTIKKYDLSAKTFSKEVEEKLLSYHWYGNVRELISVIERATILSEDEEITVKDLFLEGRG